MPHASDQSQVGKGWRQLQKAHADLGKLYEYHISGGGDFVGRPNMTTVVGSPHCDGTVYGTYLEEGHGGAGRR